MINFDPSHCNAILHEIKQLGVNYQINDQAFNTTGIEAQLVHLRDRRVYKITIEPTKSYHMGQL